MNESLLLYKLYFSYEPGGGNCTLDGVSRTNRGGEHVGMTHAARKKN